MRIISNNNCSETSWNVLTPYQEIGKHLQAIFDKKADRTEFGDRSENSANIALRVLGHLILATSIALPIINLVILLVYYNLSTEEPLVAPLPQLEQAPTSLTRIGNAVQQRLGFAPAQPETFSEHALIAQVPALTAKSVNDKIDISKALFAFDVYTQTPKLDVLQLPKDQQELALLGMAWQLHAAQQSSLQLTDGQAQKTYDLLHCFGLNQRDSALGLSAIALQDHLNKKNLPQDINQLILQFAKDPCQLTITKQETCSTECIRAFLNVQNLLDPDCTEALKRRLIPARWSELAKSAHPKHHMLMWLQNFLKDVPTQVSRWHFGQAPRLTQEQLEGIRAFIRNHLRDSSLNSTPELSLLEALWRKANWHNETKQSKLWNFELQAARPATTTDEIKWTLDNLVGAPLTTALPIRAQDKVKPASTQELATLARNIYTNPNFLITTQQNQTYRLMDLLQAEVRVLCNNDATRLTDNIKLKALCNVLHRQIPQENFQGMDPADINLEIVRLVLKMQNTIYQRLNEETQDRFDFLAVQNRVQSWPIQNQGHITLNVNTMQIVGNVNFGLHIEGEEKPMYTVETSLVRTAFQQPETITYTHKIVKA